MRHRIAAFLLLSVCLLATSCAACSGCPESAEEAGLPRRVKLHQEAPER